MDLSRVLSETPSTTPDGESTWTPAWAKAFRHAALAFLLSRVILTVVGLATVTFIDAEFLSERFAPDRPLIDIWARWDSEFFVQIAEEGYSYTPGEFSTVPFFPLYPLLIRLGMVFTGDALLAGILISNLCGLAALTLLYELTRYEFNERTAIRTVSLVAFFPNSFYLSAVYSESLFLLLSVAALYFARQERWGYAVIAATLSTMTRFIGVMMVGVIGLAWLNAQDWRLFRWHTKATITRLLELLREHWRTVLLLALIPLGVGFYLLYLWAEFGSPFVLFEAESVWDRHLRGPHYVLFTETRQLLNGGKTWWFIYVDLPLAYLILPLIYAVYRRLPESYFLLVLASALIPLSSSTLSFNRFVLVMFPLFMVSAASLKKRATFRVLWALSALMMVIGMILFARGFFVA